MNNETLDRCNKSTEKIIEIIESLGFTTEREIMPGGLRALISTEVRRCVSDVVTEFYNSAALVPTGVINDTENLLALFEEPLSELDKNEQTDSSDKHPQ